jgi:hypothetical protein
MPGAVPTARGWRLRNPGKESLRTEDIRRSGIYPLLGPIPPRRMGGETQDGEEPISSSAQNAVGVVPEEPAQSHPGATSETPSEAERALRILRDHRQLVPPLGLPETSAKDLEALAQPAC